MIRLLAVDPGVKVLGWAIYHDDRLEACGLLRASALHDLIWEIRGWQGSFQRLVVEKPQVYQQRLQKGDPNDLIDVALVAGAVLGHVGAASPLTPKPREWKGQVPKEAHHRRIRKLLSIIEAEHLRVAEAQVPKSLEHNMLDAVGLGLWALDRMG